MRRSIRSGKLVPTSLWAVNKRIRRLFLNELQKNKKITIPMPNGHIYRRSSEKEKKNYQFSQLVFGNKSQTALNFHADIF